MKKEEIVQAAEDAGVVFEETYDGVRIDSYLIDAEVTGAAVYHHIPGTFGDVTHVATFENAEAAVASIS